MNLQSMPPGLEAAAMAWMLAYALLPLVTLILTAMCFWQIRRVSRKVDRLLSELEDNRKP